MEIVTFKLNGAEASCNVGEPLVSLIGENGSGSPLPVVAALVNNSVKELSYKPVGGENIQFLTPGDKTGNDVYLRGLLHVLVQAVKKTMPESRLSIEHSMNEGIYCEIRGEEEEFSPFDLERIEREMHRICEKDEPFIRRLISREEAIAFYRAEGNTDKARLLRHREDTVFKVYSCGGVSEYFFGHMPPSTGYVSRFALVMSTPGFVLLYPRQKEPRGELRFTSSPKLAHVFRQSERWADILGVGTVPDLNDLVDSGQLRDFIRVNEALHERTISEIASRIAREKRRIVLVAGPSSSGKTTFTQRLSVQLRAAERKTAIISLDNYYRERSTLKPRPDGTYDLEDINALDVPLFNQHLCELLEGKEVQTPRFDFKLKKSVPGKVMKLLPDEILMIEGIHGLNDAMSEMVDPDDKFKVYISALTQLNLDSHDRISTSNARLIRRLVRDHLHRGMSAERTLGMWSSVREGEDRWIFPYQEQCDVMFNSTLVYELLFLKKRAIPLLKEVSQDSPNFIEANYLAKLLKYFVDPNPEDEVEIPRTSILREFIGGGSFEQ